MHVGALIKKYRLYFKKIDIADVMHSFENSPTFFEKNSKDPSLPRESGAGYQKLILVFE